MSRTRLLFLLSLPRSGSTLLQRMLGSHSQIATVPEPWVLLPQFYAVRPAGTYASYGHRTAVEAIQDFTDRLPEGMHDYLAEVREFTLRLYEKAGGSNATYFLDKTPRYSLIVRDLMEMFPDAKFLVLWRNPLAVVASICETWLEGRWKPYLHKIDLFEGLEELLLTYAQCPGRFTAVRYEDIVTQPEDELQRVLEGLELGWEAAVVEEFTKVKFDARMGDRSGVSKYEAISTRSVDAWKESLASPVRKAWSRRYLRWLGQERLALMGYRLDELLDDLDAVPADVPAILPDAYFTAKGVLWAITEPDIVRGKWALLPAWRRIVSHS